MRSNQNLQGSNSTGVLRHKLGVTANAGGVAGRRKLAFTFGQSSSRICFASWFLAPLLFQAERFGSGAGRLHAGSLKRPRVAFGEPSNLDRGSGQ